MGNESWDKNGISILQIHVTSYFVTLIKKKITRSFIFEEL